MGNKKENIKRQQKMRKMQKTQKRHRDNNEELFMRELDNIVMDVIGQVNNSLGMVDHNSSIVVNKDSNLTNILGDIDSISKSTVNILDVYDSLLSTNVQIGNILDSFQGQLAKSKDVDAINDTIMDFTEDFLTFQVWLKKQLHMYDNVNFTHVEEMKVGKEYLKICKGTKNVKMCLHDIVTKYPIIDNIEL
jgi:hypothetical protein